MKLNAPYIFLMLISLASCSDQRLQDNTETSHIAGNVITFTDEQVSAAKIKTGTLTEKEVKSLIRVNGKIDVPPQNLVSVSVAIGGYLRSTHLLPGMHVRKGEQIAVLEDQQYIQLQQDYLTIKARLEAAEADFNRQSELNAVKAGSDKALQQAKAEYQSQKVALKSLGEKLKLINIDPLKLTDDKISKDIMIFSPFDGYVSKVNVNIGRYITPSDVLFELVNPNDIHLNLKVFEKDLNRLAIGQELIAFTNTEPDKKHPCKIILISKDIAADHTAEVHCHFEDYDKTLLPGMYMNAEIQTERKKAATLPTSAIVSFEGKNYVFILKSKNQFELTEITTGEKSNDYIEVINSSDITDKEVATEGAYTLLMALKNTSEE